MLGRFSVANYWPSLLDFNDYADECVGHLLDELEYPTDLLLQRLVMLQATYDHIHTVFRSYGVAAKDLSDEGAGMHLSALKSSLHKWHSDTPPSLRSKPLLELSYNFVSMELHSIALRRLRKGPTHGASTRGWESQSIDSLLTCLEAGKKFVEQLLALETSHLASVSFAAWVRLPYVLTVTANLCFPSEEFDTIHWNCRDAQDSLRFDHQVELFCGKMQALTSYNPPAQPRPDFFASLEKVFECAADWYRQHIQGGPEHRPICPDAEKSPLKNIGTPSEQRLPADDDSSTLDADFDFWPFLDFPMDNELWDMQLSTDDFGFEPFP